MKRNMKYILSFLIVPVFLIGMIFTSCKKDDSKGTPKVQYVRVTNPAQADSLLTGAFMGNLIAIMGENLGDLRQVWFNDKKALVTPTYVTDNSVLVSVPNTVPNVVTNKIYMIFKNGDTLKYDFQVLVPAPQIDQIKCEYVADGDSAVITGNYFYDPQVFFVGDQEATVLNATTQRIQVKVPTGAGIGPITVKTRFGKMASKQVFRDDRGIFLDFDTKLGAGWRPGLQIQSTNPTGCSGKYDLLSFKYNEAKNNWNWSEDNGAVELWGQSAGRPNGPLFTVSDINKAVLKFEAYVIKPWTAGWMQFIFSPWNNANNSIDADNTVPRGFWRPWWDNGKAFQTDGWITVTLPLSGFTYNPQGTVNNLKLNYPAGCGSLTIFCYGPPLVENVDSPMAIAIDNVRVIEQ